MIKLLVPMLILLLCAACDISKKLNVQNIKGYEFSFIDVQKYCTVIREDDSNLAITCEKHKMHRLMNSCEGVITEGLNDPEFYCSGGLWVLNGKCHIKMQSSQKGSIWCKQK